MTNSFTFTTQLGRLPEFDERSRNFKIRSILPQQADVRSYTWSCPVQLDQGEVPACTGFAVAQEAAARPVRVKGISDSTGLQLYHRAQLLDQWPGEDYYGSSVLAAIKAGQELGWYEEYRWAFNIWDLLIAIGYKGPAVLGINWYSGMFYPDANGLIRPTGQLAGGHAIVANGVSVRSRLVRLHNSWGSSWGINGECYIGWGELQWLLDQQGEACIPVLRKFS